MTSTTAPSPPLRPARADAQLIGLVGMAHLISHFSQLLLAPLFPWLKDAFAVSYAELGLLMTIFFVVSCVVQASSGFVVDRFGPRPPSPRPLPRRMRRSARCRSTCTCRMRRGRCAPSGCG